MTKGVTCEACGKNLGSDRLVCIPYATVERFIDATAKMAERERHFAKLEAALAAQAPPVAPVAPPPVSASALLEAYEDAAFPPPQGTWMKQLEADIAEGKVPDRKDPGGNWRDYGIAPPMHNPIQSFDTATLLSKSPPPPPR